MALKLLFFAQCADWVGCQKMELVLKKRESLAQLIQSVPELRPLVKNKNILKVAVNQEFSNFNVEVKDGDEVAFLPPVSGG